MQKRWKFRLLKASAKLCRRTTNVLKGIYHLIDEVMHIVWSEIRQLTFSKRPYCLIGIQLWGVGWEIFYPEAWINSAEHSKGFSFVSRRVVEQGDDGPAQVA